MRLRSTPAPAFGLLALLAAGGLLASSADAGTVVPLTTRRVASGLNRPVFATHAPGDEDRLFILEQRGVIKILDLTTETLLGTPFLDIDALVLGPANTFDERGLLGLAFHPDYDTNGFFYINYINNSGNTVVARYTVSANPDIANPASASLVLGLVQPQANHNGGWLGFGPDGYLYIATGDGGNFCDTGTGHTTGTGNAQDITTNLLGKMLRIDVDGGSPYASPPGNPFVGVTGDDEIWAYGLRNPWRPSFDRETGDLYIADVGQDAREEINYQQANGSEDPQNPAYQGGHNYGWRGMEGNSCSSISGCSTTGCTCNDPVLTDPIHEYSHAVGFSITGGYAYRGCDIPSLQGRYFYADFGTNQIWTLFVVDGHATEIANRTAELDPPGTLAIGAVASFGEDARGEVYIVDRAATTDGEIYKVISVEGYPDFDCNAVVDVVDLLELLGKWGPCPQPCPEDVDRDGQVGVTDLLILLAQWTT